MTLVAVALVAIGMRDGPPARLVAGRANAVVVNSQRPMQLPFRVLDAGGRSLGSSRVVYEWLSGAPASVSESGVVTCSERGDPVEAVDMGGERETMLTGRLSVGDRRVATLKDQRLVARRAGSTSLKILIGDQRSDMSVHVFEPARSPERMTPGQHVGIPVRLTSGETRRWQLAPAHELYYIAIRPDRDGGTPPHVAIIGAQCMREPDPKMATSKGVIQGYTGVAAVDAAHQIIVVAQAHGTDSEQALLVPIVEALPPLRGTTTMITADAGHHSEANLRALDTRSVEALLADRDLRKRDERFATQSRHQQGPPPLHDKTATPTTSTVFTAADFTYDAGARTCVCPAGKSLYRSGGNRKTNHYVGAHVRGTKRTAGRARCAPRACGPQTPPGPQRRVLARTRRDRRTHAHRADASADRSASRTRSLPATLCDR